VAELRRSVTELTKKCDDLVRHNASWHTRLRRAAALQPVGLGAAAGMRGCGAGLRLPPLLLLLLLHNRRRCCCTNRGEDEEVVECAVCRAPCLTSSG